MNKPSLLLFFWKSFLCTCNIQSFEKDKCSFRGCHGHDRMVVGFTTTCAISAYHHWSCEYKPCWWGGVLDATLWDKVCQWFATGRWFSLGTPVSSTNKTDGHNITEICLVFFHLSVKRRWGMAIWEAEVVYFLLIIP